MYKKYIKRLLDIITSLLLIIILSPIFIITSIILIFTLRNNIIFKQKREGLYKKPYTMYKFRTMIESNELSDKQRITKFGRILRNLSIDELPQLFNVLNGTMSIIGPRPFICGESLPKDKIDDLRYSVRPGMTGYAQVMGKRLCSHKNKLKYDIIYANEISLLLDIKIFILTFRVIFQKESR